MKAIKIVSGLLLITLLIVSVSACSSFGKNQSVANTGDQIAAGLGPVARSVIQNNVPSVAPPVAPNPVYKAPEVPINSENVAPIQTNVPVAGTPKVISKNKPGEQISTDSLRVLNNVWGAPPEEKFTSGINLYENGIVGWHWDRPNPQPKPGSSNVLPIYPNVRLGGNPWEKSKSPYFPVKMGDIQTLTLDTSYKYLEKPTGLYDLAYDIFLTDSNQLSYPPKIKAEVMIWIPATLGQPSKCYKEDVSDGQNMFKLYSWVMGDGRLYYSFLQKGEPQIQGHHSVDAKKLIDNLKLDPSWYLQGVELGNEVMHGSGQIEISQFQVDINGQVLSSVK